MSTCPSRQSTRGWKRGTPAQTERNNNGAKCAQPNVEDVVSAGPSRIVAEGPTTGTNQMTGEAIQLEDDPITPLHQQGSHSTTSCSVGESSQLTQGTEMAPGEVALLKAKISTLGVQLSELQQRYRHTQAMEPPSSVTHSRSALSETLSRSASMPRLSPQPQLVHSLGLSDGHTSSLGNIDTIAERIPKGIKCLPAFDDKTEDFQTWKLRLEAVADVYKWTDNQKQCVVLSTLRGEPARFAFKALGPEVQNDYKALIEELSA